VQLVSKADAISVLCKGFLRCVFLNEGVVCVWMRVWGQGHVGRTRLVCIHSMYVHAYATIGDHD